MNCWCFVRDYAGFRFKHREKEFTSMDYKEILGPKNISGENKKSRERSHSIVKINLERSFSREFSNEIFLTE